MDATRWQRIESVFEEARRRAPAERAAFLDESCGAGTGADADLRAEVESLLASAEQAPEAFMRQPEPIGATTDEDGPDPLIGQCVGSYTIKSVIATGGMGTVYEAVQDNPERIVALKMLRAGITSSYALRHFEYESRVLARLSHPNIAQIYQADTYTPAGGGEPVPYFAMEYIEHARTLTDYADDRQLDTRQRLKLFAEVCEAVHHGHQKGIIHRDLKPGNILVDAAGRPKIIDFGIARSTDADVAVTTMQTSKQHLVGTLQYMSPEQCEADPLGLDTRSDVYSLGVVLYELLCGCPPYDIAGSSLYLAPRIICTQRPARPSTIRRAVRGDIERIVLKALEKDREQRYQSADDLANDLRRHLRGDPITARPPGPLTHIYRFARRHPILASACASLAIAGTTFIATKISIDIARNRPDRIWCAPDGSRVTLFSVAEHPIKKWPKQAPGRYTYAELVERPEEFGGGQLAVIGFDPWSELFPGKLCAFDIEVDLEQPLWCRGINEENPVPASVNRPGRSVDEFCPRLAMIADVFSERSSPDGAAHPGQEIVAIFRWANSETAIRIYDLNGELLYEAWHDGALTCAYWMSEDKILVLAGLNSEVYWADRGYPDMTDDHPRAVLGVRPVPDHYSTDFLSPTRGENFTSPLWYKCLLPPEKMDGWSVSGLFAPPAGYDGSQTAALVMSFAADWADSSNYARLINSRGNFDNHYFVPNDPYQINRDRLTDPKEFKLGDLPPIVIGPKQDSPP